MKKENAENKEGNEVNWKGGADRECNAKSREIYN